MLTRGVDCSDEARRERQEWIKDLRAKIYSGVSGVSDRSRSVNYASPQHLRDALRDLLDDEALCETGGRRASRLSYNHLVKAL